MAAVSPARQRSTSSGRTHRQASGPRCPGTARSRCLPRAGSAVSWASLPHPAHDPGDAGAKTCPEICPELGNSEPLHPHLTRQNRPYLCQLPCKWATYNEGVGGSSPPAGLLGCSLRAGGGDRLPTHEAFVRPKLVGVVVDVKCRHPGREGDPTDL